MNQREYASVWTRLGALFLDGLLVLPFYLPIYVAMALMGNEMDQPGPAFMVLFIVGWLGGLVFAIWNQIVRMGKTGQSLGRKFLNIAVLTSQGQPIGVGKAALREIIGRWVSGIVCYIGYLNAFWDKDRQMWHDKMANCYVYYVDDDFSSPQPGGTDIPPTPMS